MLARRKAQTPGFIDRPDSEFETAGAAASSLAMTLLRGPPYFSPLTVFRTSIFDIHRKYVTYNIYIHR